MWVIISDKKSLVSQGVKKLSNNKKFSFVDINIDSYSDGESNIFVDKKDIVSKNVIIMHSLSSPVNSKIIELCLLVDAVRRAGALRIILCIPYLGYARQDRAIIDGDKVAPISAKVIASIINAMNVEKVFAFDPHALQIGGFYDIPFYAIKHDKVLADIIINNYNTENLCIIAPDAGAFNRAKSISDQISKLDIDVNVVVINKQREAPGVSKVMNIGGNVVGKNCVVVDDIVDSAGTLCNAAEFLLSSGAKSVGACISHGVLSGKGVERIRSSKLSNFYISNSIHRNYDCDKIKIFSIHDAALECITEYI